MKTIFSAGIFCVTTFLAPSLLINPLHAASDDSPTWNSKAAAAYLDQRAAWWMAWPSAARDHETFCVSCHTALPYALSRPTLRNVLAEQTPSPNESKLLENVTKRVRLWNEVLPFYNDEKQGVPKTTEARGTESVLNALILVTYDAANYDTRAGKLGPDTRTALNNMWALQLKTGDQKGAWSWLNFHNEPWEADDSQYWGAALAAIAVGTAPGDYRSTPEVREGLNLLIGYLQQGRQTQSLLNRLALLWASTKIQGLLKPEEQKAIVSEVLKEQQEDGGWSATSLVIGGWKRRDNAPLETQSDGYGTGLASFVLLKAGVPRTQAEMKKALTWLSKNQDPADGQWQAYSLNKKRDPASDAGHFMGDAATAYSVLALTEGKE
jgi:squalene-hopene/tetraprenyl-beta-curcumene cyclase